MLEAFTEREQASLIANDILVLVSELNAKAKQAAENGLRVELSISVVSARAARDKEQGGKRTRI